MDYLIVSYLREAILIVCYISAPALLTALFVGFAVSFLQAATQIQEHTLSYVPKIFAVFLVLLISGQWMMLIIIRFSIKIMTDFNLILEGCGWN
ncbi:flagellar biosynthetic protein FliQ [bacterium]|nr:flagellar biosynthetic protein FliQ [candidate division CSSED10-310 bacterium]